jgi:hypothetical protein
MRRHAGWGRMRRPRACFAKHAPGRRRGSAWWPIGAARQELADGGRPVCHGRPRKARPGAARKTPQIHPDVRKLVRVARRAAPRISERECGHINNNGCAPWRAIPLIFEGRQWEDGPTRGLAKQYG